MCVTRTLCRVIIGDAAKRPRPERGLRPEITDPFHASLSQTRVVAAVCAHRGQVPAQKYDSRVAFSGDAGVAAVGDRPLDRVKRDGDIHKRTGVEGLLEAKGRTKSHEGASGPSAANR